ncbi:MAG: hypothetical protein R3Y33_04020 [Clostridia bacterium]
MDCLFSIKSTCVGEMPYGMKFTALMKSTAVHKDFISRSQNISLRKQFHLTDYKTNPKRGYDILVS